MYPLNMTNPAGGYALANDADEHKSLSDSGYEPKIAVAATAAVSTDTPVAPSAGLSVAQLKDALDAKGIEIPEGAKKPDLAALLDAAE